jgi:hypothetical protein
MNDCCTETMKRMLEEIIQNMKAYQFTDRNKDIQAMEYALSMLNERKK